MPIQSPMWPSNSLAFRMGRDSLHAYTKFAQSYSRMGVLFVSIEASFEKGGGHPGEVSPPPSDDI